MQRYWYQFAFSRSQAHIMFHCVMRVLWLIRRRQGTHLYAFHVTFIRQEQPAQNNTWLKIIIIEWQHEKEEEIHARFNSLLIVSAGTGSCTRASWIPSEHVVDLLPQLLSSHLGECRTLDFIPNFVFIVTDTGQEPKTNTTVFIAFVYSRSKTRRGWHRSAVRHYNY